MQLFCLILPKKSTKKLPKPPILSKIQFFSIFNGLKGLRTSFVHITMLGLLDTKGEAGTGGFRFVDGTRPIIASRVSVRELSFGKMVWKLRVFGAGFVELAGYDEKGVR